MTEPEGNEDVKGRQALNSSKRFGKAGHQLEKQSQKLTSVEPSPKQRSSREEEDKTLEAKPGLQQKRQQRKCYSRSGISKSREGLRPEVCTAETLLVSTPQGHTLQKHQQQLCLGICSMWFSKINKYGEKGEPPPGDRFSELSNFTARRHGKKIVFPPYLQGIGFRNSRGYQNPHMLKSFTRDPTSVVSVSMDSVIHKFDLWIVESAGAEPTDKKHHLYLAKHRKCLLYKR